MESPLIKKMKKKILVIDDDPVVLRFLESILTDNGYEVYKANDGIQGLSMLDSVKPDLITLDLQMPEQGGARFYRAMTKHPNHRRIPVIVISGLAGGRYSLPKAAGFLAKPFTPEDLVQMVKVQIGQEEE